MRYATIRRLAGLVRKTPLHPQWLLEDQRVRGAWIRQNAAGLVLDIGCADRWIERWLPAGSRYVGLDYPPTGQAIYRARPEVFGDASRLPLADGSVDTVVLLEVFEHLRRPQAALAEARRVLRPAGRLLLSLPFLYPIHDAPHDFQRLTAYGLRRDLEDAGFTVDTLGPALGAYETAGLIACIALAEGGLRAVQGRRPSLVLLPLLALAIPLVNLAAWLGGKLLPACETITAGYQVCAVKPAAAAGLNA